MKRRSQKKTYQLEQQLGLKKIDQKVNKKTELDPNDYTRIHENQKRLKLLYEKSKKNKTIRIYSKVKYKQHIYQIGEFLHLFDPEEKSPFVVRLHQIIQIQQQQQGGLTILKVEWLLKKTDLPPTYDKYVKHFSVAEVFPSKIFFYVPIESVMSKCYLITYQEYQFLQNAGENIHFCRAFYSEETGQLQPKVQSFTTECYCKMPVNPDLIYVQCEKCEGWFHHDCIPDKKELEKDQFFCKNCPNKK